uniref:DM8 domain-containing protein n=1 Tax=Clastoptera arizonana TaxID=38151 RepID=A0A1B6DSR0_9HEMI
MCEINLTSFSMELNSLLPKNFKNDIQNIEPDIMVLLDECFELLHEKSGSGEAINVSQIIIDITWEQLNTGHWSEVEDSERQIYALASLLKVVAMVQNVKQEPQEKIREILEAALKVVDMGLLLGSSYTTELNHIANLLNSALYTDEVKDFESSRPTSEVLIKVDTEPLKSLHCPSLETFSAEHFYPRQPVKLIGCISHWKALKCWKDVNYLLRVAGGRTVPIELGSKYTDSDWSQKLMTLRTFISKYVVNAESSENAYLAQHQLFNQAKLTLGNFLNYLLINCKELMFI